MNKAVKIVVILCAVVLLITGIASALYLKKEWDRTTYFENTTINGFDASLKEPADLVPILTEAYTAPVIHIAENGEESVSYTLSELGFRVDEEGLKEHLEDALRAQKTNLAVLINSMMGGNTFDINIPFLYDPSVLEAAVGAEALKEPRVAATEAEMRYNEKENYYYIEPETYGNEFDDADLRSLVEEKVTALVSERSPQTDITIDIPESFYVQPAVTKEDIALNNEVNILNSYCKAKITYVFGTKKEVVDWKTVQEWLSIEDGQPVLDTDSIHMFVTDLASRYNTVYYDRPFATSVGTTVTIPSYQNEYGYMVSEEGEYDQLMADLAANTETEREPVYAYRGYSREGADDLNGNYVEVNLSAQHLWFYKEGRLVVETDIVSGSVAKGNQTQTGCFPLPYKESPSRLVGQGGTGSQSWDVEVQYWMPFYDGQGLHDADWRSSFGGNIYVTNGSHGCVNLPPQAAAAIYAEIDEGMAIILYQ